MIEFLNDFIEVVWAGLDKLNQKNLYFTFGSAVLLSSLCVIFANNYTRLWNKGFKTTFTHKVLSSIAAFFTFIFVISFVSLTFLQEIANMKVLAWSSQLSKNKIWENQTSLKAYNAVESNGLENMSSYQPPDQGNVVIPINSKATLDLCAEIFTSEACANFDKNHPFLSKIVWAKKGLSKEIVVKDIEDYFGGSNINFNSITNATLSNNNEFDTRLQRENGGDGIIHISLLWNNVNDLDLKCVDPEGTEINYSDKKSTYGELDVDMNASSDNTSNEPIENIRFPFKEVPEGSYKVYIKYYSKKENTNSTTYRVRVKVNGQSKEFKGEVVESEEKLVHSFNYTIQKNQNYKISDAVALVSKTIRQDLISQTPRVVKLSRLVLFLLFIVIQCIPFGLIGYAAYRDLKIVN